MVVLYFSRNILFSKHIFLCVYIELLFCMCLVLDTVVKIEGIVDITYLILKLKSIVLRTRLIQTRTYMNNFFCQITNLFFKKIQ